MMKATTKWYRKGTNEKIRKSQVIAETKQAIAYRSTSTSIEKIVREFINTNYYCIKGEKNYAKRENRVRETRN